MNKTRYKFYIILLILLATSVAYIVRWETIYPNYLIVAFLAGMIAMPRDATMRWKRWLAPAIILLTDLIILLFITSFEGRDMTKLALQLLSIPVADLAVYFLGYLVCRKVCLKSPMIEHVFFIFYVYLCFLVIFLDHTLTIGFWAIFSLLYAFGLTRDHFSLSRIFLIFGLYPFVVTAMYLFFDNIFFWSIGLPNILVIFLGILFGYYHGVSGGIKGLVLSVLVFAIGGFGLGRIVSENITYMEALSSEEIHIPDYPLVHQRDTISLQSFKGKVVVLDFWHTKCGVCYKKFPEFDALKRSYEGNDEVVFFAVNKPLRQDSTGQARKIMDNLNYSFDNLYLINDSIPLNFGIVYYPTLVIINKGQNKMIRSDLELSKWVFNNTKARIDALCEE